MSLLFHGFPQQEALLFLYGPHPDLLERGVYFLYAGIGPVPSGIRVNDA